MGGLLSKSQKTPTLLILRPSSDTAAAATVSAVAPASLAATTERKPHTRKLKGGAEQGSEKSFEIKALPRTNPRQHICYWQKQIARDRARTLTRESERELKPREGAALKSIRLPELGFRVLGFMRNPFFNPQHTQNGYNVFVQINYGIPSIALHNGGFLGFVIKSTSSMVKILGFDGSKF